MHELSDTPQPSAAGQDVSLLIDSDESAVELLDDEGPLQRVIEILVPKGERPERVDQFLARMIANSSRSKVQEAIAAGVVTLNGSVLERSSYKIKGNDLLTVTIPRPPRMRAEAEDIPINIVFEDDDLLIINKPAGMVVHPAHGSLTGTLVNALLHHIKEFREQHPGHDPDRPETLSKVTQTI